MTIYHVETQEAYDALMSELEVKGYKWLSGRKPTSKNYWKSYNKNICIVISDKYITFGPFEQIKNQHPNIPITEYKAKGENMAEEMTQEEMKRYFLNESRDVSIAIENFVVDDSTTENPLLKAKSSAEKLIEKIDEYLETLKHGFKVGDYVTLHAFHKEVAKIEKIYGDKLHGLWYDRESESIRPDYYLGGGTVVRHARPSEIEEYEASLTFHKHGRNPFEVKKGDILRDDEDNILINNDNILSADFPKNLKKHYFTSGKYTLLKTVEEYNEWLENK